MYPMGKTLEFNCSWRGKYYCVCMVFAIWELGMVLLGVWNGHGLEKFFTVYGNGLVARGEMNSQVCDLSGRQLNFGG